MVGWACTCADSSEEQMPKKLDERKPQGGAGKVTQERLGSNENPNESKPKLPHERDETADSHSSADESTAGNRDVMRQAHDDIASGKQDTDRGPVIDKTYHDL